MSNHKKIIILHLTVVLILAASVAGVGQTIQLTYDQGGNRIVELTNGTLPQMPTISHIGDSLLSSSPTGNQWFFNGAPLGDTTSSIFAKNPGTYSVIVSLSAFCPSDTSTFVLKDSSSSSDTAQIVPNPVRTTMVVEYSIANSSALSLALFDITGRELLLVENVSSGQIIDMVSYSRGVYIVKLFSLTNPKVRYKFKILKL